MNRNALNPLQGAHTPDFQGKSFIFFLQLRNLLIDLLNLVIKGQNLTVLRD